MRFPKAILNKILMVFALLGAMFLPPSGIVYAAVISWDGGGDGSSWHDPLNWSTNTLPTASNDVVIDIAVSITVTHSTGTTSINSLQCEEAFVLSGGSLAIAATSQINNTFTLSGGTLSGTGNLTVSNTFNWTGGTIGGGGGSIIIPSLGVMNISGANIKSIIGIINNSGTATWSGTGDIYGSSGATFNNLSGGIFDVQNNQAFLLVTGNRPNFNNAGTFRKSIATGTTTFSQIVFNNNGIMDLQSGTLNLNLAVGSSNGTATVSSGAGLTFSSGTHTFNATSSISGSGTVTFSGAAINIAGINITANTIISGGEPLILMATTLSPP